MRTGLAEPCSFEEEVNGDFDNAASDEAVRQDSPLRVDALTKEVDDQRRRAIGAMVSRPADDSSAMAKLSQLSQRVRNDTDHIALSPSPTIGFASPRASRYTRQTGPIGGYSVVTPSRGPSTTPGHMTSPNVVSVPVDRKVYYERLARLSRSSTGNYRS